MSHTDVIPTSASTVSTGPGIRYIQNWAYAYSGNVGCNGTETTLLEFQSSAGLIRATVIFNYIAAGVGEDFEYSIYMNDQQVQGYNIELARGGWPQLIYLIIPPLTLIKMTARNTQDNVSRDQTVSMIGRVYGAE